MSLVAAEELNFIAKTLAEKHWRRALKAVMKAVEDNRTEDIIISLLYTVKTTGNQFYNIELESHDLNQSSRRSIQALVGCLEQVALSHEELMRFK